MARDRIYREQILPGITIKLVSVDHLNVLSFTLGFANCDEMLGSGATISLIKDANVDVIIGPVCSDRK